MRLRIAFVAMLASVALVAVGVPAASANGTSTKPLGSAAPLYTTPVSGFSKSGKQVFSGHYGIQRFKVATLNGKKGVYAVGTLKGKLNGQHITRYNVLVPAKLTNATTTAHDAQTTCPVLHLVIGPVNLNLLGLQVTLGGGTLANQPIVLDITAVQGPGNLLGNLLCGITNALNGNGTLTALQGQLQQLSSVLNGILGLFAGL